MIDPDVLHPLPSSNCAQGNHRLCNGYVVRSDYTGKCQCPCHPADVLHPLEAKPDDREIGIRTEMRTCKHFRGLHRNDACAVGVNVRALVGGDDVGWATRVPCLTLFAPKCGERAVCDKREFPTRDEAEATEKAHEATIKRFMTAHRAAHDDAKTKGYKRGKGGQSQCVCPCCGGTLRYSVAAVNGHLWGKCETEGCVQWME